jgi:hypothetical protein
MSSVTETRLSPTTTDLDSLNPNPWPKEGNCIILINNSPAASKAEIRTDEFIFREQILPDKYIKKARNPRSFFFLS